MFGIGSSLQRKAGRHAQFKDRSKPVKSFAERLGLALAFPRLGSAVRWILSSVILLQPKK
jgi:hypothetical protein